MLASRRHVLRYAGHLLLLSGIGCHYSRPLTPHNMRVPIRASLEGAETFPLHRYPVDVAPERAPCDVRRIDVEIDRVSGDTIIFSRVRIRSPRRASAACQWEGLSAIVRVSNAQPAIRIIRLSETRTTLAILLGIPVVLRIAFLVALSAGTISLGT